ncbi:MAG: DUF4178 domain-containing protein, partial [Deltaproteobacteria bacterium]
ALFQGKRYEIVGRLRYEESDEEETWFWDEWFLVSTNGQPLWLTEAEGHFFYFKKFVPVNPVDPRTEVFQSIDLDGEGPAIVEERGSGKIVFLEGEFTWQARLGEVAFYLDAHRGERRYTIEFTEEEIEFAKGRELEAAFVYRIFKIDKPLPSPAPFEEETEEEISGEDHGWGPVLLTLAGASVCLMLLGFFGLSQGSVVTQRRLPVPAIAQEPGIVTLRISNARNAAEIDLETALRQRTFGVTLEIYDEAGEKPLFTYETEFWDESGTDIEGYWHESDESEKILVRFPRPGRYRLHLAATAPVEAQLQITVKEGVWLVRWFFIAAGISGFLPLLVLVSRLEFSDLFDATDLTDLFD